MNHYESMIDESTKVAIEPASIQNIIDKSIQGLRVVGGRMQKWPTLIGNHKLTCWGHIDPTQNTFILILLKHWNRKWPAKENNLVIQNIFIDQHH